MISNNNNRIDFNNATMPALFVVKHFNRETERLETTVIWLVDTGVVPTMIATRSLQWGITKSLQNPSVPS